MRPIVTVAEELGLPTTELRPYRGSVVKVPVPTVRRLVAGARRAKLVLVTGMTPTSHGEGKTVTAIGVTMALRALGRKAVACLRQPSLGPVFGIKGGATGGGVAHLEPAEDINLGLTGDLDAVASAHDLLSALIDNHLFHGNDLGIVPASITWPRTLDVEDRALRHIVTGAGGGLREIAREGRFVIAAASEIMAIVALAPDYADLKARLGRILVGRRSTGAPVRAEDLGARGAMAALLRHALEPNLVQATDGTPVLVHGGPFGNIAHGTCSRISIELGLSVSDYCVVEAGFATDLGAEKFVDIVARQAGWTVDSAVLVATVRSLRHHGGAAASAVDRADVHAVERGLANLDKHLENLRWLGIPTVVAVNRFPGDTEEELAVVRSFCEERGVPVALSTAFSDGAGGTQELAERVIEISRASSGSRPLYPDSAPLERAVETIATRIYGANGVDLTPLARSQIEELAQIGEISGPVCVAKTQLSLSDDPARIGRPADFSVSVHRVLRAAGAGFTVVYLGDVETLPGLPKHPLAAQIDLTDDGQVTGLL
jgi:formate--tetrahydrofolate ligase